jgi:DNA-binding MarR family transcriptional regulator
MEHRPSRALVDADYKALAQFRHAMRVFQRFSEQAARGAGLTPAQHQLLLSVRGHPGGQPPAISDIAESLQLRHHSVVELIDRAESAALVRRATDRVDQRKQRIMLTPRGRTVLEKLSAVHRDELRRFRREMVDVLGELDRP